MAVAILTQERLHATIDYNPDTGIFTRKIRTAQCHRIGDRADFVVTGGGLKGYHRVALDSSRHLAHRLAWFYVYGIWPNEEIDHIDGNRANNRISNLRDVSSRVNLENMIRPRIGNKSGFLGVLYHPETGKWRARIQVNKKSVHIGLYETPELAYAAYVLKKRELHEGCTI